MTSRHTQRYSPYNVGDWSRFFNEEPFYAIPRTLADADASEKVCEECKDTLHRRVTDAATIEKLFEDFQATLQTRVADVVQEVCEEFTATLPHMVASANRADHDVPTVSQDRKEPPLVLTDCSDT
ncbi:unnamed protein product [Brassica rapa subsp. trilocularis]